MKNLNFSLLVTILIVLVFTSCSSSPSAAHTRKMDTLDSILIEITYDTEEELILEEWNEKQNSLSSKQDTLEFIQFQKSATEKIKLIHLKREIFRSGKYGN